MPLTKQPLIPHVQRGKLISDGLVASWMFAEGSGTTAYDLAGNDGRHATWSGTGSHWTSVGGGYAGSFNGTDDFLTVADTNGALAFKTSGRITVTAKVIVNTGTGGTRFIVDKRLVADDGWYVTWDDDDLFAAAEGTTTISAVAPFLDDGIMHSIACTFNAAGSTSIYIDGVFAATNTTPYGVMAPLSDPPLCIGGNDANASFFKGTISDLRIYSRVLSTDEIALIHAGLG